MRVSRGVGKLAVLGVVMLLLTVAGCGRRGKLEPPPNPDNPFQPGVEKPVATPGDDGSTRSKSGLQRRPKNPPIKPPNEPFLLDPLL